MTMQVWSGPSLIDGAPIVLLATFGSGNSKTGRMTQTNIVRADMAPRDAIDQGADTATCGDCIHRSAASGGLGSCYVHPIIRRRWGTAVAWQQWHDGNAEPFDPRRFEGRPLRLGTYGDPAAVPTVVWAELVRLSSDHTGYTHQWRRDSAQPLRQWCMASCDSAEDEAQARAMGWDTFTVLPVGTVGRPAGLKPCPASAEAGRRLQCESCLRCGGTSTGRRGNRVAIVAHGGGARKFVGSSLPLTVAGA